MAREPIDFSNPDTLVGRPEHEIRAAVEAMENEAEVAPEEPAGAGAPGVAGSGDAGSGREEVATEPGSDGVAPVAGQAQAEGQLTPEQIHERGLRNALTREREEARQWRERVAYLEGIVQSLHKAQEPEEEPIDPFERITRENQRLRQQFEQFTQQQQAQAAQAAAERAVQAADQVYAQQHAEFVKVHPDLADAARHVQRVVATMRAANGAPNPEAVAAQEIVASLRGVALEGRNAPQALYEYARTLGYTPKAPVAPQQQQRMPPRAPLSLSQVSSSSEASNNVVPFDPVRMMKEDYQALVDLQKPENSRKLERLIREAEAREMEAANG